MREPFSSSTCLRAGSQPAIALSSSVDLAASRTALEVQHCAELRQYLRGKLGVADADGALMSRAERISFPHRHIVLARPGSRPGP
jgi:hypothetical protein